MMDDVDKVIKSYEIVKAFLEIPNEFFNNIDDRIKMLLRNKINGYMEGG